MGGNFEWPWTFSSIVWIFGFQWPHQPWEQTSESWKRNSTDPKWENQGQDRDRHQGPGCVSVYVSVEREAACLGPLGSSWLSSLSPQGHHWLLSLSSISVLIVDLSHFLKGSKFLPFLILLIRLEGLLCCFSSQLTTKTDFYVSGPYVYLCTQGWGISVSILVHLSQLRLL